MWIRMFNTKVSVIIPVYNVQQYLSQCVQSIFTQSYQNLEIILVDDGSTDDSGRICDTLAQRDSRIQVIHKTNGGLSDARNAGTAACSGEFVFYLDSDDYLERDAISSLMKIQEENHGEVVVGNYFYTYSDHEDIAQPDTGTIQKYTRKEAISLLMQGKLQTFAWGKLIRADIAKRHMFPVGKLFEDHFWTHFVFQDCETVVYSSKPVVHYRQRGDSISYTFNLQRLDIIEGWRERIVFLQQEYPDMVEDYLCRCAGDTVSLAWLVLTRMKKNKKQGFVMLRRFIRQYQLDIHCEGQTQKLVHALRQSNLRYSIETLYFRITRGDRDAGLESH